MIVHKHAQTGGKFYLIGVEKSKYFPFAEFLHGKDIIFTMYSVPCFSYFLYTLLMILLFTLLQDHNINMLHWILKNKKAVMCLTFRQAHSIVSYRYASLTAMLMSE